MSHSRKGCALLPSDDSSICSKRILHFTEAECSKHIKLLVKIFSSWSSTR